MILTPSVAPKTEPAMERPKVEKELRTLLVVEDNNEIRQYLKSKLATIYNVFPLPYLFNYFNHSICD